MPGQQRGELSEPEIITSKFLSFSRDAEQPNSNPNTIHYNTVGVIQTKPTLIAAWSTCQTPSPSYHLTSARRSSQLEPRVYKANSHWEDSVATTIKGLTCLSCTSQVHPTRSIISLRNSIQKFSVHSWISWSLEIIFVITNIPFERIHACHSPTLFKRIKLFDPNIYN